MGLRDIGNTLPPGFRFYPSDEELVCHYLYKKISNEEVLRGTLVEIDLHTCEPWQLPDVAKLNSNEWYFFSFRDRKYATGFRTNRATTSGYWKATGKDRAVLDPMTRALVGMRKTLVFYKNRAPNGIKTGWIMHEFRLESPHVPPKEDWVLCRVFHKSRSSSSSSGGESSTENYNYNLYQDSSINTAGATSPNLSTSPTNEHAYNIPTNNTNCYQNSITTTSTFPHSPSHHQQGQNPNTSLGLSVHDLHQMNNNDYHHHYHHHHLSLSKMIDQSAKCEDDYGFLFDMSFDDSINGGLEDMRFDDDNSSIFI